MTFLEHVAADMLEKYGTNLSRTVVVFPNKRASLFLNNNLARITHQPLWSPSYKTITNLFRDNSELTVGDDIKLVCDLYQVYKECTGSAETLDHFYGWGTLMLSDFDDIDKNMADPHDVFRNISNVHELDDISYLTAEQREVLKRFFINFSEENNTELKRRFLRLWQNFGEIYSRYNEKLKQQKLAYEGALYREVVSGEMPNFNSERYIFVGFSMLQKVEQQLFTRLAKAGKAKFYWDFDRYYIDNNENEAGHYIRRYLEAYPNELSNRDAEIYDNLNRKKNIHFISASTETIQACYVGEWLEQDERIAAGRRTAVVLCDENLLQTVLHSMPPQVENVNITTGFPLSQSPVYSLVNALISLQTVGVVKGTNKFRLHNIRQVLRHPYVQFVSEESTQLLTSLETQHTYYPDRKMLARDKGLDLLFSKLNDDENNRKEFHLSMLKWMLEVLRMVGTGAQESTDQLMKEAVFRMYTLLNRLSDLVKSGDLDADLNTLQRLITQLVQTTVVPFHGEPVSGVQVMGMLETRNLDFDNVLLLSCNEGNMPKGINDASFIPYAIRKAHELTTADHKVAIYSYHFHRLLQRAKNITVLYNNSTEDGHTGEMSRFMLQLMVESRQKIERLSLRAGQVPDLMQPKAIEKSAEAMQTLLEMPRLSPTAINRYLRCQLQFFYSVVAGIKESDDDSDEIDNRTFGNIFHHCSQMIYEQLKDSTNTVSAESIARFVADKSALQRIVDQVFNEELFKVKNSSQRPEYNGLQLINRGVIISYLLQLLDIDRQLAPFTILAMEDEVLTDVSIKVGDKQHTLAVGGIIDRLDRVQGERGGIIRVVDYKTGSAPKQKVPDLDALFSTQNISMRHSDYYLQAFIYSMIVRHSEKWNKEKLPVSPALLFIQQASASNYDPVLSLGKGRVDDVNVYREPFWQQLQRLLEEIFNPNAPFVPTDDRSRCNFCPYRRLCEQ